MRDMELRNRLDKASAAAGFGPTDPAQAIRIGTRQRRRRAFATALSATGVIAVLGVASAAVLTSESASPSLDFGDPGDRAAAVGAGGPADGYPDLVVSVHGTTITGFGWPLEGQPEVSTPDGQVSLPPIDEVDAETMCLPMLNQAAPEVPNAAWHHSESWIDDFPTRAGLITSFEAEDGGRTYYAACTLPGDHTPQRRPDLARVPAAADEDAVRAQCGYLGHVDLGAWDVVATDRVDDTLAAALVAPDGTFARCVLSGDVRQRLVQLSEMSAPTTVFYSHSGETVALVGRTDPAVERLTIRTDTPDAAEFDVPVYDGVFATVAAAHVPFEVTAYDGEGNRLQAPNDIQPVECFTSVETGDDGC